MLWRDIAAGACRECVRIGVCAWVCVGVCMGVCMGVYGCVCVCVYCDYEMFMDDG